MISVQTNVAALYGLQNLSMNQNNETKTIQSLTSGYRINGSADDPAGLAISNQLRNQSAELTQGVSNGNNAVAQLQIVDGGLTNISQILDRLQTLATQASSTTFTGNFGTLANEFNNDLTEITRQAGNIGMNSGGNFQANLSVYVGGGLGNSNGNLIGTATESIDLSASAADSSALGFSTIASSAGSSAYTSIISVIAAAVTKLGALQGAVGAGINQLTFSVNLAQSQITNYSAEQSQIRDANMAEAATTLSKQQTLMQSTVSALSQANQMNQSILKLLQ